MAAAKKKRIKKQKRIAVFDCETDPFKHGRAPLPFVVGFYDGDTYRYFWGDDCIVQFVEFLHTLEGDWIIYAHNGGKFDFLFMIDFFEVGEIRIIRGRIAKAKIANCELRDSYLILPLPLAAHDKGEIDYRIMEDDQRDKPKNRKLILEYLERDCRSLHSWVTKFRERFGEGMTIAGRAFDQLEQVGYEIPNADAEYDAEIRPYYYGGRVQYFQVGKIDGPLQYIDVNSAYPRAMMEEHPHYAHFVRRSTIPAHPHYFATIKAKSRGALPFRAEDEHGAPKLLFPSDTKTRIYQVTGWEIDAGLETGTLDIVEVMDVIEFVSLRHFREHVEKFYAEKQYYKDIGDLDNENFAKLMLNSPYGRFGTNPDNFEDYQIYDSGDHPGDGWELAVDLTDDYNKQLFKRPSARKIYFNVATAASITGWQRANLWRAICASEAPIYCDTDSLICKSYNGEMGKALGQWKLEANVKTAYIGGKKIYALETYEDCQCKSCTKGTPDRKCKRWKTAHKGFQAPRPDLFAEIIESGMNIEWQNDAPAMSIKGGTKFVSRNISMVKQK